MTVLTTRNSDGYTENNLELLANNFIIVFDSLIHNITEYNCLENKTIKILHVVHQKELCGKNKHTTILS